MIHFRHVFTLLFAVKTLCWPGHWPASNFYFFFIYFILFATLITKNIGKEEEEEEKKRSGEET